MCKDRERQMQLQSAIFDALDKHEGVPVDMIVEVAVSIVASLAILGNKDSKEMHRLIEAQMKKIARNRDVLRAVNFVSTAVPAEA